MIFLKKQTTDLKLPAASNTQSAIVGVVGGLIAVGAITVISVASVVIVIMVVVKRKTERIMKGCSILGNYSVCMYIRLL